MKFDRPMHVPPPLPDNARRFQQPREIQRRQFNHEFTHRYEDEKRMNYNSISNIDPPKFEPPTTNINPLPDISTPKHDLLKLNPDPLPKIEKPILEPQNFNLMDPFKKNKW